MAGAFRFPTSLHPLPSRLTTIWLALNTRPLHVTDVSEPNIISLLHNAYLSTAIGSSSLGHTHNEPAQVHHKVPGLNAVHNNHRGKGVGCDIQSMLTRFPSNQSSAAPLRRENGGGHARPGNYQRKPIGV